MPIIPRLPQKSSGGSVVLTGDAIASDVASGKTFYNTDSSTKLTGTASGGGMILPVGLNCKPYGAITIPNGVTSLDKYAFFSNAEVTSVVMANTITSMQDSAFESCTNLTTIELPSAITAISNYAFSGCAKLNNIIIPSGVTNIGSYAFSVCAKLNNITIPSGVTQLNSYAFSGCTKLNNIIIPTGITNILLQVFGNCTGLTTITINATVISIHSSAFIGCTNLEFVTLANGFNSTLNLSYSTKYSRDTIMAMINAYANASGKTLTIGTTNLANLSVEDKAVATSKGLTLA